LAPQPAAAKEPLLFYSARIQNFQMGQYSIGYPLALMRHRPAASALRRSRR
jgi:hypothetical protein